jgi:uncharacterized protein (TIGR00251 family)
MKKTCKISLKVIPGTSKNEIAGWLGDKLKVKVTASAKSGKANLAVIKTLSNYFNLTQRQVNIFSGDKSAYKIVELDGISETQVNQLLKKLCDMNT